MTRTANVVLLLSLGLVAAACSRGNEEAPVATPGFSVNRGRAPLGSPVEVSYRFAVAQDAKFAENYRVFVHFLDPNDEQMWTDDHDPPTPTTKWRPGQVIEYTRTLFIPRYPFVGEATVKMGLYSPRTNQRVVLNGDTQGQRAYTVGTLTILPNSENVALIFKEGWNTAEIAKDNASIEWQWTKKDALVSFRNPRADSTLYLQLDGRPDLVGQPQRVTLSIGSQPIDDFQVTTTQEVLRRIPITAAQFGDADMIDLRISVDPTFVPARTPAAQSSDIRELGVRVFHVYVEPKQAAP